MEVVAAAPDRAREIVVNRWQLCTVLAALATLGLASAAHTVELAITPYAEEFRPGRHLKDGALFSFTLPPDTPHKLYLVAYGSTYLDCVDGWQAEFLGWAMGDPHFSVSEFTILPADGARNLRSLPEVEVEFDDPKSVSPQQYLVLASMVVQFTPEFESGAIRWAAEVGDPELRLIQCDGALRRVAFGGALFRNAMYFDRNSPHLDGKKWGDPSGELQIRYNSDYHEYLAGVGTVAGVSFDVPRVPGLTSRDQEVTIEVAEYFGATGPDSLKVRSGFQMNLSDDFCEDTFEFNPEGEYLEPGDLVLFVAERLTGRPARHYSFTYEQPWMLQAVYHVGEGGLDPRAELLVQDGVSYPSSPRTADLRMQPDMDLIERELVWSGITLGQAKEELEGRLGLE